MRANLWKNSFNGGELSPRLDSRTDQIKYASGAKTIQGFIPTVQGPIIRRGGTYFVAPEKDKAHRNWLVKFQLNIVNGYVLEFGDRYIRFFTNRGFVSDVTKNITAITQANPGTITSVAHTLSNGDMVQINGVVGMTRLNAQFYTVANASANTLQLVDVFGNIVNTLTFMAYISGGTISRVYTIASPYAVADLTNSQGRLRLRFFQSQSVLYIAHPSYPLQSLSRFANTNWTIARTKLVNGPFQAKNSDTSKTVYVTPTTTAVTGAANNGAGLIRLAVSSTTGLTTGNNVNVYGITGTTEANGTWPIILIDATHVDLVASVFTNVYTAGGTVIGREGSAISITANASIFSSVGADSLFYLESPISTNLKQWSAGVAVNVGDRYQQGLNTYIAITAGTTGTVTPVHTSGVRSDGVVSWMFEDSGLGVIQLSAIAGPTSASGTIQIPPPFVNGLAAPQTSIWAHGQFGLVQGYPEIVTVFRDRLTLFKGIQAMGSVSDDYLNFAPKIGGQQTADSGFVITLPTANSIMWAVPGNDLLVGTQGEELIITEINPSSALGPTNIRARRQTQHGSVSVDAVPVEFVTMFITRSGQQLRQEVYDFGVNGYIANDMTMFGEHIPKGPDGEQGITQMDWAANPDTVMWGCTTDGRLVGFTYHSEQQVTAWHPHPVGGSDTQAPLAAKGFTNAVIESVVVIPSPQGFSDDVWLQVKRTINGQEMRYIEYMTLYWQDIPANIKNAFYVDCGLTYNGVPTNKIYGNDHLIGQTVDVLVNGGTHPQVVVGTDGSVTLQDIPVGSNMVAQIGLPCPARFVGLRPEGGTQIGTAQTLQKKITKLGIRMLKTLGIKFGDPNRGESTFTAISFRSAIDPMDTAVPPFTGDKGIPGDSDLDFPSGTNGDGYVEILCDQPLPCTITGIRATVDVIES